MQQLMPRDAQMYWLASRIPNDQFLLYCFEDAHESPESLREFIARRSAGIADLRIRVRDVPGHVDYPYWVRREFGDDQLVEHALVDTSWRGFTAAMGELLTAELDARVSPWRLHIFRGLRRVPQCDAGEALVAVLQVSHALADGRRASSIARALFGEGDLGAPEETSGPTPPDAVLLALGLLRLPLRVGMTFVRGVSAYRAHRALTELVEAGEIPPENPGQPLTSVNAAPGVRRHLRMIVCSSAELRSPDVTITVAVLTAISAALSRYLELHGAPVVDRLGAEVPLSDARTVSARNNFHNVGVDLYPDEPDLATRADKIGQALDRRRVRSRHPLMAAQGKVTAAVPAPGMWHEVNHYPLDSIPETVSGNTVVSSVFRGLDDLRLAGGQVKFTAGFPALSPVMGLTHGAHGIGDTVTISITCSPDVIADIDEYEDLLRTALAEVGRALARGRWIRTAESR